jgi:hypothetical protein
MDKSGWFSLQRISRYTVSKTLKNPITVYTTAKIWNGYESIKLDFLSFDGGWWSLRVTDSN